VLTTLWSAPRIGKSRLPKDQHLRNEVKNTKTDLINNTRHDARDQLQRDVRELGAEGVVIQRMDMRVGEHECPAQEGARDHVAEMTIVGTAITHFTKSARAVERPSLAILSLDPQRRQAARIKLGKV